MLFGGCLSSALRLVDTPWAMADRLPDVVLLVALKSETPYGPLLFEPCLLVSHSRKQYACGMTRRNKWFIIPTSLECGDGCLLVATMPRLTNAESDVKKHPTQHKVQARPLNQRPPYFTVLRGIVQEVEL